MSNIVAIVGRPNVGKSPFSTGLQGGVMLLWIPQAELHATVITGNLIGMALSFL